MIDKSIMALTAAGSFREYDNPGLMLYFSDKLIDDERWPFEPDEQIIISIDEINHRVEQRKAEWHDLIPWKGYPDAYRLLPQEIKDKIPKGMIFKGRFKHYKKSGAMLYVKNKLAKNGNWPFEAGEMVKITIENERVIETRMRWFEMLDWEGNPDMYARLRPEIKEEMKQSGIQLPYIQ